MAKSEAESQALPLMREQTRLINEVTDARAVGDTVREAQLQRELAQNKLQLSQLGK